MNQSTKSRPVPRPPALADDPGQASYVAETLKALSHPVRLRIIALLSQGDEHVSGLGRRLALKQAIVSQQLRILRMARLVDTRRERGFVCYTLAEPRLRDLLRCFEGCRVPPGRGTQED